MKDLKSIQYIVIDVDGTMTDAGIYYDEHGNELKKFCTKDAAGFFTAKKNGNQNYGADRKRMRSHPQKNAGDEGGLHCPEY